MMDGEHLNDIQLLSNSESLQDNNSPSNEVSLDVNNTQNNNSNFNNMETDSDNEDIHLLNNTESPQDNNSTENEVSLDVNNTQNNNSTSNNMEMGSDNEDIQLLNNTESPQDNKSTENEVSLDVNNTQNNNNSTSNNMEMGSDNEDNNTESPQNDNNHSKENKVDSKDENKIPSRKKRKKKLFTKDDEDVSVLNSQPTEDNHSNPTKRIKLASKNDLPVNISQTMNRSQMTAYLLEREKPAKKVQVERRRSKRGLIKKKCCCVGFTCDEKKKFIIGQNSYVLLEKPPQESNTNTKSVPLCLEAQLKAEDNQSSMITQSQNTHNPNIVAIAPCFVILERLNIGNPPNDQEKSAPKHVQGVDEPNVLSSESHEVVNLVDDEGDVNKSLNDPVPSTSKSIDDSVDLSTIQDEPTGIEPTNRRSSRLHAKKKCLCCRSTEDGHLLLEHCHIKSSKNTATSLDSSVKDTLNIDAPKPQKSSQLTKPDIDATNSHKSSKLTKTDIDAPNPHKSSQLTNDVQSEMPNFLESHPIKMSEIDAPNPHTSSQEVQSEMPNSLKATKPIIRRSLREISVCPQIPISSLSMMMKECYVVLDKSEVLNKSNSNTTNSTKDRKVAKQNKRKKILRFRPSALLRREYSRLSNGNRRSINSSESHNIKRNTKRYEVLRKYYEGIAVNRITSFLKYRRMISTPPPNSNLSVQPPSREFLQVVDSTNYPQLCFFLLEKIAPKKYHELIKLRDTIMVPPVTTQSHNQNTIANLKPCAVRLGKLNNWNPSNDQEVIAPQDVQCVDEPNNLPIAPSEVQSIDEPNNLLNDSQEALDKEESTNWTIEPQVQDVDESSCSHIDPQEIRQTEEYNNSPLESRDFENVDESIMSPINSPHVQHVEESTTSLPEPQGIDNVDESIKSSINPQEIEPAEEYTNSPMEARDFKNVDESIMSSINSPHVQHVEESTTSLPEPQGIDNVDESIKSSINPQEIEPAEEYNNSPLESHDFENVDESIMSSINSPHVQHVEESTTSLPEPQGIDNVDESIKSSINPQEIEPAEEYNNSPLESHDFENVDESIMSPINSPHVQHVEESTTSLPEPQGIDNVDESIKSSINPQEIEPAEEYTNSPMEARDFKNVDESIDLPINTQELQHAEESTNSLIKTQSVDDSIELPINTQELQHAEESTDSLMETQSVDESIESPINTQELQHAEESTDSLIKTQSVDESIESPINTQELQHAEESTDSLMESQIVDESSESHINTQELQHADESIESHINTQELQHADESTNSPMEARDFENVYESIEIPINTQELQHAEESTNSPIEQDIRDADESINSSIILLENMDVSNNSRIDQVSLPSVEDIQNVDIEANIDLSQDPILSSILNENHPDEDEMYQMYDMNPPPDIMDINSEEYILNRMFNLSLPSDFEGIRPQVNNIVSQMFTIIPPVIDENELDDIENQITTIHLAATGRDNLKDNGVVNEPFLSLYSPPHIGEYELNLFPEDPFPEDPFPQDSLDESEPNDEDIENDRKYSEAEAAANKLLNPDVPVTEYVLQNSECHDLVKYYPQIVMCCDCIGADEYGQTGEYSCRFIDFRKFPIYTMYESNSNMSFLASEDKIRDNTKIVRVKCDSYNRTPELREIIYKARHVFPQFLTLIQEEVQMTFYFTPQFIRPFTGGYRDLCDSCFASIFNRHWICKHCGRVLCITCFKELVDDKDKRRTRIDDLSDVCINNELHSIKHFILVEVIPRKQLRFLLKKIASYEFMLAAETLHEKLTQPKTPINIDRNTSPSTWKVNTNELNQWKMPYDLICDERIPRFVDPNHSKNLALFRTFWVEGIPIVVSGLEKEYNKKLWTPRGFMKDFSNDETCEVIDCRTSKPYIHPVQNFWDGFTSDKKKIVDPTNGLKCSFKIKDFPSTADLKDVFPDRFDDFYAHVPMPSYTKRTGFMNLANDLPDDYIRPDLGPKLYVAYSTMDETAEEFSSTNLHLDLTDAVNIMTFARNKRSEKNPKMLDELEKLGVLQDYISRVESDRSRGKPVNHNFGAIWHIFHAKDTEKIRQLLREVSKETNSSTLEDQDPIHDQSYYIDDYLRQRLKDEYNVVGYNILQFVGDAVFIPAGAAHQVRNLKDCVKIATDFFSVENLPNTVALIDEFRRIAFIQSGVEDKLQVYNTLFNSAKDCVKSIEDYLRENCTNN